MEVCGHLHAPAVLLPGKSPLYPLNRRLGGPQNVRYFYVCRKALTGIGNEILKPWNEINQNLLSGVAAFVVSLFLSLSVSLKERQTEK
jgi:hypothetical protein